MSTVKPADLPDPGHGVMPGDHHYRAFVGATETYDIFSHMQFSLMTLLGLRQHHSLLDIGCGSLRAGKLFIVYLLPDRYRGIEPEEWLVQQGIDRELGRELAERKRPRFVYGRDFPCTAFGETFDFLLAQSIFSHASIAQIRRCLAEAQRVMKPSSLFAASFVEGDADYQGSDWVYPQIVRYRATTIAQLASENGLACRRIEWFHIGGQAWFVFFLPGREPEIEALATLNQTVPLKEELSHYRKRSDRLDRIEATFAFRAARAVRRRLLWWL